MRNNENRKTESTDPEQVKFQRTGRCCCDCLWFSSGINDPHGATWCYSEGDYVPVDGYCACWEDKSKRINPDTGDLWPAIEPAPLRSEYQAGDDGEVD